MFCFFILSLINGFEGQKGSKRYIVLSLGVIKNITLPSFEGNKYISLGRVPYGTDLSNMSVEGARVYFWPRGHWS